MRGYELHNFNMAEECEENAWIYSWGSQISCDKQR